MPGKTILIPTDFTPSAQKAVDTAVMISKRDEVHLTLLHITSSSKDKEAETMLHSQEETLATMGVDCDTQLVQGSVIPSIIENARDFDTSLTVIGTHGVKGLKQHLFGAYALKIAIQSEKPTLIVQETTEVKPINKILFPYGGHDNFDEKVDAAIAFAKMFGATVSVYSVKKDGVEPSPQIMKHIEKAKESFTKAGISFDEIIDPQSSYSVGYSKQINKYAGENNYDMVIVMAASSKEFSHIAQADKEAMINNENGIPVLLI